MLTLLISLAAGALGGIMVSAGASRWSARRQRVRQSADPSLDPNLDQRISEAARHWAANQGQPAAAPLMANKLRLIHAVSQRRRRPRRWWR